MSLKKPRRKTVSIIGDDEALERIKDLQNALEDEVDTQLVTKLKADLKAAEEALEASTLRITLQSIGRKRYEELVSEHPPTEAQNKESEEATGQPAPYNTDTFPPALIAASAVDPEMTVEQATELWDEWNTGELMELFFVAIEVNTQRRVGLGKESGPVRG